MSSFEVVQEHGAPGVEAAAEATSHGLGSIADIPGYISHHLEDATTNGLSFQINKVTFLRQIADLGDGRRV